MREIIFLRRYKIFTAVLILLILVLTCSAESAINGKEFYRSLSKRLSKNRNDYPKLSDNEFANFREVAVTGIAKGKLYRSSSPISTWGNRNVIADKAIMSAGVKTIINLADSDEGMKKHKGYEGSYYSQQKVAGLNVNTKYKSRRYRNGLANGIHFMAENEPPYLVHCSLGKDRAGFTCAVIECLAGAELDEVIADYMISFYNYFGILPGTDEYNFVANAEIYRFLCEAFGLESLEGVNLSDSAERYLRKIGVSASDIESVKRKLGR